MAMTYHHGEEAIAGYRPEEHWYVIESPIPRVRKRTKDKERAEGNANKRNPGHVAPSHREVRRGLLAAARGKLVESVNYEQGKRRAI